MPQFVPIVLFALIIFVGLYLGYTMTTQPFSLPKPASTGFASAAPNSGSASQSSVPAKINSNIFLGNDFSIFASRGEELVNFNGEVDSRSQETNSIANDFSVPENADRIQAALKISQATGEGEITIFINQYEIYKGRPKVGKYTFEIDKSILQEENTLRVEARSGWIFSHASYDFNLKLYSLEGNLAEYRFFVKDTSNRKLDIGFSENTGVLKIIFNGKEIFYGHPKEFLSIELPQNFFSNDENRLELLPEADSNFRIDFIEMARK